jgi:hypothetical protein
MKMPQPSGLRTLSQGEVKRLLLVPRVSSQHRLTVNETISKWLKGGQV